MRERGKLRGKLTYANVMVTILTFVVLGGGAYAAGQLAKNSVGTKQLKKNAVTTAKIRKNAVTAAKIRKNAVTAAKIKSGAVNGATVQDGSLTGADVNAPSMPFAQIVHKARGNSTLVLTENFQVYPLDSPTYTQGANEDNGYTGAIDFTIPAACTPPRIVDALVLVDAANPTEPNAQEVGSAGFFRDEGTGAITAHLDIGSIGLDPGRFEPGTTKSRTLSLVVQAHCNTGSGLTVKSAGVDVIGITAP